MLRDIKYLAVISMILFCTFSCTEEIVYDSQKDLTDIRAIIVSEGQFGYGTSSLTSLSYDGTVQQDLFKSINNRPMGDVAQSMTRIGNYFYVPQNNSRKIEVMDCETFESVETMPIDRDVIPMYVQYLGGDSIAVTDQRQNSQLMILDINHGTDRTIVRRTIPLGQNNRCFQMCIVDDKLFVGADQMTVFDLGNITADGMRRIKQQDGETLQKVDFSKIEIGRAHV